MRFKAVIHPELTGGYWGEVPALPGCYSQGETVDELLVNLREAIADVLEEMREEGRSRTRRAGSGTGGLKPITGPELCRKLGSAVAITSLRRVSARVRRRRMGHAAASA